MAEIIPAHVNWQEILVSSVTFDEDWDAWARQQISKAYGVSAVVVPEPADTRFEAERNRILAKLA